MKNLKKVLALVLSLAMIASTFTMSFAAEEKTAAEVTEALGLIKGDGNGVTEEYLASESPRWKIAIMTLRLKGLYEEALAFEGTETFEDAEEMTWEAGRAILAYLKANPELGWAGYENKIDPNGTMTVQQYYKVMLETLGYKQGTDFEWAEVMDFAAEKGLVVAADAESLTMADVAAVTVEVLNAENSEGTKLVEALVEAGAIEEAVAAELNLVEVAPTEVALKSAVALNSKVVEVALSEAAEEVTAAQFSVMDADDEVVNVESVELAPWDADNKTVLVTLADNTASGKLYTITSGDTKANFGGRKEDKSKPVVESVDSTDYNEVTMKFSEPIVLGTLKAELAMKYKGKDALEILDMKYDGSTTVVLTTSNQQKDLYGVKITDAEDFAGNVMDDEKAKTFVGKLKPTKDVEVSGAEVNDYNQVAVKFTQKVDEVDASMFTVTSKNQAKTNIEVLSAKVATKNDYYGNTKIKDLAGVTAGQFVILEVADLAKTLYQVEAKDVVSLYDTKLNTSKDTATFVGMLKPSKDFALTKAEADSNTQVTLTFENKIEATTAEDISLYTITEKKRDGKDLQVLEVKKVDGKTVVLTVAAMDKTLYKVEVSNDIMDIYGNNVKSDKDIVTYVGEKIADKIKKISAIERKNGNETEIIVRFDQNVGDNVTDVAFYSVDNEIGVPAKAVKATTSTGTASYKKEVILTIPKTTAGKIYKLTVGKGIENNDGVVSTDELTKTFTGLGTSAKLPKIEGIDTLDKQTIKIYFDRNVKDSTIKGRIWGKTNNDLEVGALSVSTNGDSTAEYDLESLTEYAYPDPDLETALIVRVDVAKFEKNMTTASNKVFKLVANSSLVASDSGANVVEFGYNDDAPANPKVDSIQGINKNTILVYFTAPVKINNLNDIKVKATNSNTASNVLYAQSMNSSDNIAWEFKMDSDFVSSAFTNSKAYLYVPTSAGKDITNTVDIKDADSSNNYQLVEFGINYDAADKIDGVYASMLDNRTIQVSYPEAMNEGAVKDVSNYKVVTSDAANASATGTLKVGFSTYDSTTNVATLYLTGELTGSSKYYLAIKSSVANKLGNNTLKDEYSSVVALGNTAGLIFEFANETDAPAKPALASATTSDDRYSLTVEFDQEVLINGGTLFTNNAFDDVDATELAAALEIKAELEGLAGVTTITNAHIYSVEAVSATNYKKVKVTFNRKLVENTNGSVKVVGTITAKTDATATTGSDASSVTFGVAPSLYADVAADARTKVAALEAAVADTEDLTISAKKTVADNAHTDADNAVNGLAVGPAKTDLAAKVLAAKVKMDAAVAVNSLVGTTETKKNVAVGSNAKADIDAVEVAYKAVLTSADYVKLNTATKTALDTRNNDAKAAVTADIIADNLFLLATATGTKIKAVFGAADVANFSDTTRFTFSSSIVDGAEVKLEIPNDGTLGVKTSNVAAKDVVVTITDEFWGVKATATVKVGAGALEDADVTFVSAATTTLAK